MQRLLRKRNRGLRGVLWDCVWEKEVEGGLMGGSAVREGHEVHRRLN